jgi:NAD+ synthase
LALRGLKRVTVEDLLDIDYNEVFKAISQYVEQAVRESGASKLVLGLSGGVDSSVLSVLLTRALGPHRVVALIMPDTRITPREDVEDAVELAKMLNIEYHVIPIDRIVDSYSVAPFFDFEERLPTGNLRARVRMNILYYYANKFNALVAGSSDRSEILIGYFTKYGDGAADIYPLACLYKTQVRALGRFLGVPERIVSKPSAPRLWRDHTARSELGLDYDVIDLILYAIFDLGLKPEETPAAIGVSIDVVERILKMHRATRHKRVFIVSPKLPWVREPIREV